RARGRTARRGHTRCSAGSPSTPPTPTITRPRSVSCVSPGWAPLRRRASRRALAAPCRRPADRRRALPRGRSAEPPVRSPARPAPRAWVMWGIPAFLFLFAFFHRSAPGVVAKELMQTFGATGALIGLLSATYFNAYAGLMIPAGVLLDRLGVRWVVAAGGV